MHLLVRLLNTWNLCDISERWSGWESLSWQMETLKDFKRRESVCILEGCSGGRRKEKKGSRENSVCLCCTSADEAVQQRDASNYSAFHFSQVCIITLPNLSRHFLPISSHRMFSFFSLSNESIFIFHLQFLLKPSLVSLG